MNLSKNVESEPSQLNDKKSGVWVLFTYHPASVNPDGVDILGVFRSKTDAKIALADEYELEKTECEANSKVSNFYIEETIFHEG